MNLFLVGRTYSPLCPSAESITVCCMHLLNPWQGVYPGNSGQGRAIGAQGWEVTGRGGFGGFLGIWPLGIVLWWGGSLSVLSWGRSDR